MSDSRKSLDGSTDARLKSRCNAANSNMSTAHQKIWQPKNGIVFTSKLVSGGKPGVEGRTSATQIPPITPPPKAEAEVETLSDPIPLESELQEETIALVAEEPATEEKKAIEEEPISDELPETSSGFRMTGETFRAAKKAEPGSTESFWSHSLYRGETTPGEVKKPVVHYCKSMQTTESILKSYFLNEKVIGFDIEWNPEAYKYAKSSPRQNVSLIQIASESRIALFHIALYPKTDPENLVSPLLKQIMEDPEITKVGVAIKADCTRLRKHLQIDSKGLFELSHLYKLIKYSTNKDFKSINKSLVSLAAQVREHLHLPLFKGGDVRSSNWSQKLLLHQIIYAAADSYAAVQLFNTMEVKRKALDPTPPRPYHAELNLPIRIAEGVEIDTDAEVEEAEGLEMEAKVAPTKRKYTRAKVDPSLSDSSEEDDFSLSSSSSEGPEDESGSDVDPNITDPETVTTPPKYVLSARKNTRSAAKDGLTRTPTETEGIAPVDGQPKRVPVKRKYTRSAPKVSSIPSEFTEVEDDYPDTSETFGLSLSPMRDSNLGGSSTRS